MRLRDDYLATYNDIIYNTFFGEHKISYGTDFVT